MTKGECTQTIKCQIKNISLSEDFKELNNNLLIS